MKSPLKFYKKSYFFTNFRITACIDSFSIYCLLLSRRGSPQWW